MFDLFHKKEGHLLTLNKVKKIPNFLILYEFKFLSYNKKQFFKSLSWFFSE